MSRASFCFYFRNGDTVQSSCLSLSPFLGGEKPIFLSLSLSNNQTICLASAPPPSSSQRGGRRPPPSLASGEKKGGGIIRSRAERERERIHITECTYKRERGGGGGRINPTAGDGDADENNGLGSEGSGGAVETAVNAFLFLGCTVGVNARHARKKKFLRHSLLGNLVLYTIFAKHGCPKHLWLPSFFPGFAKFTSVSV